MGRDREQGCRATPILGALALVIGFVSSWSSAAAQAPERAPSPTGPVPRTAAPAPPSLPTGDPADSSDDRPAAGQPAAQPPTGAAPAQGSDLATRYRFIERYAVDPAKAQPRELSVYQVGSRDTIRIKTDRAQGAPSQSERVVQIIYTERPAGTTSAGAVTDTVRHYDRLAVSPAPPEAARAGFPTPLEGLTLWYKTRPALPPQVMVLGESRSLSEAEYSVTMRQIFLPDLIGVLPGLPSRVGDRWRIPRGAAQALMGDRPAQGNEPLIGTLLEVRPPAPGSTDEVAVISVTGHAMLPSLGDTYLNARIHFTFAAPGTEGAAAPAGSTVVGGDAGVIDARGAITELRLARSSTAPSPNGNGRLKTSLTWELVLQRRVNTGNAPPIPTPPPTPTPANSWLTYDDAKGRFHFRHPQELLTQRMPAFEQDDIVQLGDSNAGADEGHILILKLQPKSNNPVDERNRRDPEFYLKELNEEWAASKQDVLRGQNGWLPDADWALYKMRVYHIEAAVRPGGPEGRNLRRIFLDRYIVQFTQDETLVVDAMTGQDPPTPFRRQVEEILKTFVLGPSPIVSGGAGAPATPPGPAAPPVTPAPPAGGEPASAPAPGAAPAPASAPVPAPATPGTAAPGSAPPPASAPAPATTTPGGA